MWKSLFRSAAVRTFAVAIGAAAGLSPIAVDAQDRSYTFSVTWSVFPDYVLANGTMDYFETADGYIFELTARALLAVPPVDWRGFFDAEGLLADGGARSPLRFERRTVRPGREEIATVAWGDDGLPITALSRIPASPLGLVQMVPDTDVVDAVDPLTFVLDMLDRVIETNGASCDYTARTWDGARLAEITVVTADLVPAARIACQIIYDDIQGLPDESRWRAREETTTRFITFERRLGRWEPVSVRIDGDFAGMRSSFVTAIEAAP